MKPDDVKVGDCVTVVSPTEGPFSIVGLVLTLTAAYDGTIYAATLLFTDKQGNPRIDWVPIYWFNSAERI